MAIIALIIIVLIGIIVYLVIKTQEQKDKLSELSPRSCLINGHQFVAVYDESNREGLSKEIIDSIDRACFSNGSNLINALRTVSPVERVYVHSVCIYCGDTVKRPKSNP